MEILNVGVLVTAVGVLVIITNALTELFKNIFTKIPAQITATVIALFLTVSAVMAYLTITHTPIEWYMIVGAIVAGFFVSYTAQFGYDKLMEIVELIGGKNDI